MTNPALDSAYAPSDAQIAAAKAAGFVAWFGYFKFGDDGVLNGWADSDFQRVLAGGLQTGAYCSGWAPPDQVKARAAAVGIRARLDVEGGIRPDGPWVQPWLDASGAGLYGNAPVFPGRHAADYILAAYPTAGDPGNESWPSWVVRPAGGPCGWQWAGSHAFAGITVDATWLDDGFFAQSAAASSLGGLDMATADQILAAVTMPPGPKPASVAAHTDADLLNIAYTSTWAAITAQFGADGEAYIYALAHPLTVAQAIANLKVNGTPVAVDLSGLSAQIAAIKAEEDAIKAQLTEVQGHVDQDLK